MGKLLHNREVRRYLLALCTPALLCLPLCFWLNKAAGFLASALFLNALLVSLLFTRYRYRRLEQLSGQLAKICAGEYVMDIGQYAEGELSILSSEILKITGALSHQAQSLRRDKAFLADSLADISHQLKTPLTSVAMMCELLSDPHLTGQKRAEFLAGIRQGADRIQWLIASLLKLSRLDAGAVAFNIRPVALAALLEQAASPLRIPLEVKGQNLRLEGAEGIVLPCDKHWLAEAVGNLLKNCVEHTPAGGHILVSCAQNALYTSIAVSDDGPGFDKDDLPHLFERFYRGRNAAADGVGIGLALAKTIIQSQGGVITAQNRPGGGALFALKLYGGAVV